jgi:hypothetical protein
MRIKLNNHQRFALELLEQLPRFLDQQISISVDQEFIILGSQLKQTVNEMLDKKLIPTVAHVTRLEQIIRRRWMEDIRLEIIEYRKILEDLDHKTRKKIPAKK